MLVYNFRKILACDLVIHPHMEVQLCRAHFEVHILPSADDLQHHHPETVDIALLRDGAVAHEPLRRQVPASPSHHRESIRFLSVHQLGEPEVGELGGEFLIQEDVLGLHVAVDNSFPAAFVQVRQSPRNVAHDGESVWPCERARGPVGLGEEVLVERAVGHELVHQEPLGTLGAVAEQAHQIEMVYVADGCHLKKINLTVKHSTNVPETPPNPNKNILDSAEISVQLCTSARNCFSP